MKISIVFIANKSPSWAEEAQQSWLQKLPSPHQIIFKQLKPTKHKPSFSQVQRQQHDCLRLQHASPAHTHRIAMDEKGKSHTSIQWAKHLQACIDHGQSITFFLGGADGLSPSFKQDMDTCWSLSSLTLPHHLARVMLVEQLYRAALLNQGHPYHRP